MLDKSFLQSFLRVNNASLSMSDAEVRGVLQNAGWPESEIISAVTLLRSESTPMNTTINGQLSFRQGMEFSSSQLSELLGVDVVIDPGRLQESQGRVMGDAFSLPQALSVIGIIILATGLAAGAGIFAAFLFQVGPFHV